VWRVQKKRRVKDGELIGYKREINRERQGERGSRKSWSAC
jgi:hypothetical protein